MRVNTVLQSGEYHVIDGVRLKLFSPKYAMDLLDVSKPTFYKWVREKTIKTIRSTVVGDKRYFVAESEIIRMKKLLNEDWKRGKSKLPKVRK